MAARWPDGGGVCGGCEAADGGTTDPGGKRWRSSSTGAGATTGGAESGLCPPAAGRLGGAGRRPRMGTAMGGGRR